MSDLTPQPAADPGADPSPEQPAPSGGMPEPPSPTLPGDVEGSPNAVPVVPAPDVHGRSLVLTGCAIAVVAVLVSGAVGAMTGYLGARLAPASRDGGSASGPIRVVEGSTDEPVAAAAAAALPAVVNIDVTQQASASATDSGLPRNHPDVPSGSNGSGVAFRAAPGGGTYILTNNHVIDGADTIIVTPGSGQRLTAKVVGGDPETDIAVVRVDAKLPVVRVFDSEKLVVGQIVVAIGSPFGLEHSVSSGIVSAIHRALSTRFSSAGSNALVDVIQTDAAINPGNSGGALVDRRGRLVGVNAAIYSGSGENAGIGFAIPSNTALRIAGELIAGGKAKHPFLGLEGMTVDERAAKEKKLPATEGALVVRVFKNTGAAKSGLRKDDLIVGMDDTVIRSMDDLILNTRRHAVGDVVVLKLWRDGARTTLKMTVGDKPAKLE